MSPLDQWFHLAWHTAADDTNDKTNPTDLRVPLARAKDAKGLRDVAARGEGVDELCVERLDVQRLGPVVQEGGARGQEEVKRGGDHVGVHQRCALGIGVKDLGVE